MRQVIFSLPVKNLVEILIEAGAIPPESTVHSTWQDVHYEDSAQCGMALFLRVEHPSFAETEPGRRLPTRAARAAVARVPNKSPRKPAASVKRLPRSAAVGGSR